jgi:hypothetical protein
VDRNNYSRKKMTFVSECTDWYRAIGIRFFFGPVLEILYWGAVLYREVRFIALK